MRRLKLVFRPWWDENPYQSLLADSLNPLGIRIDSAARWAEIDFLHRPDVVHLHWLHPIFIAPSFRKSLTNVAKFFIGLIVLRILGTKIVWTAHNLKNHDNHSPLMDRICTGLVVHLAHGVIAHGETARQTIIRTFHPWNPNKIFVVPHGNYVECYDNTISSTQARHQLGLSESDVVFLFLGAIRPYKGVLELITAFKQLNCPTATLVIAGKPFDQDTSEQIEQAIADQPTIKFIPGFVPDEHIQVYMNACDVTVFPYRNILTSGSVLLAMSFGRACIAPRQGCITETLDESGALLYDPDENSGLLNAMKQAVQRRSELSQMGSYNRQQAEAWSWNRIAQMTFDVYRNCMHR
ncbi:MAG TPA: glycosyltransferase family 4 protein [Elainellaceae cyanobacterium]